MEESFENERNDTWDANDGAIYGRESKCAIVDQIFLLYWLIKFEFERWSHAEELWVLSIH